MNQREYDLLVSVGSETLALWHAYRAGQPDRRTRRLARRCSAHIGIGYFLSIFQEDPRLKSYKILIESQNGPEVAALVTLSTRARALRGALAQQIGAPARPVSSPIASTSTQRSAVLRVTPGPFYDLASSNEKAKEEKSRKITTSSSKVCSASSTTHCHVIEVKDHHLKT